MANPYADPQYSPQETKLSTPQSAVRSSKRKRDNETGISTTDGGNAFFSAQRGIPAQDPNPVSIDPNNGSVGANQFDLSALQAHQAQGQSQHTAGSQSNMDSTAAAALNYTMNVPAAPSQDFASQSNAGLEGQHMADFQGLQGNGSDEVGAPGTPGQPTGDGGALGSPDNTPGMSGKPAVGSEEWHKVRKDNHKEVERRRRETINEGINELAKIVPGCEKNKGSILQRAVQFITKLQEDVNSNIDKWTFEKLITEQAISDLTTKLGRSVREREAWRRIAKDAGVDVDNVNLGIDDEDEDGDAGGQDDQVQQQQPAQVANMGQGQNGAVDEQRRDSARA